MGLAYFEQTCPSSSQITIKSVQAWCVLKEGVCCGVCPNQVATLGNRIAVTALVLFATLVVVYDNAEAPYNFLTVSMSSLAYIIAVLQAGFRGGQISKFHTYYALFASLGFLAPLAAVSVSPNSFLYGGGHPKRGKALLPHSRAMARRRARSLGHLPGRNRRFLFGDPEEEAEAPPIYSLYSMSHEDGASSRRRRFWDRNTAADVRTSSERRPLSTTNPFDRGDSSTDNSPVGSARPSPRLVPADLLTLPPLPSPSLSLPPHLGKTPSRPSLSSSRPHQLSQSTSPYRSSSASSLELNEEKETQDELGAPPSRPYSPSEDHLHPPADSSVVDEPRARSPHVIRHQTSRPSHRPFLPNIDSAEEITALPEMQAEPHTVRRRTRLQKKDRPKSKDKCRADELKQRTSVQLSGEEEDFIFDRMQGRAWRRRGYIFGNLLLWALWTVTFTFVSGALPERTFGYTQTNCQDPAGTKLLFYSIIAFLVLGLGIVVVFLFNFHNHFFSHTIHKPFSYSRANSRLTRAIVPGAVSLAVFATWQVLLWTAYEQAASANSSLQASDEQATSFTTVLAICLVIKPALDLVKAFAKARKLKSREFKEAAQREAARLESEIAAVRRRETGSMNGSANT